MSQKSQPIKETKRIKEIRSRSRLLFEVFSNYRPAGSGNYEKTRVDGRYREFCFDVYSEIHALTPYSKVHLNYTTHCGKLDCEECFTKVARMKAYRITEKLTQFNQKVFEQSGGVINPHYPLHLSIVPARELCFTMIHSKKGFFLLRKKITEILQKEGIYAGYIFPHLWRVICKRCNEREGNCKCKRPRYVKRLHPHFHVLGFGKPTNSDVFHRKYKSLVYRNFGKRVNPYYSAYYILSKLALWVEPNKKNPCMYREFGWLDRRRFRVVSRMRQKIYSDHNKRWYSVIKKEYKVSDIEQLKKDLGVKKLVF